jgi:urease accessory protein
MKASISSTMLLNLTQHLPAHPDTSVDYPVDYTLSLTAEERMRSRHHFVADQGQDLYLRLPRGTVLRHGDILQSETGDRVVRIIAKPEPVMTVTAAIPLDLLRAAYHLGNRHIPLEITATYLRLSSDPVLKSMLEQLGLVVADDVLPFQPETGAYGHRHSQSHASQSSAHEHPR